MPASTTNSDKPTIVVAILNWGLGHATRMMPLIEMLREKEVNVIIASSGLAGALLRERYADLVYHELQDYNVRYHRSGSLVMSMLKSWSSVRNAIRIEHFELSNFVKMEEANAVISDNRYGCFSSKIPSILITHQINPMTPVWLRFLQSIANRQITRMLNKFDECWIPDFPDQRLSGNLSNTRGLKIPSAFIGPLSRFKNADSPDKPNDQWLAILSGPEPQRTMLQEKFIAACHSERKRGIVLAGRPDGRKWEDGNVEIIPHLPDDEFLQVVNQSRFILMRPGYSSLMDFYRLGRNALWVPTPGQTEQQYLAKTHSSRKHFIVQRQNNLSLSQAEEEIAELKTPVQTWDNQQLEENIDRLIDKILH